AHLARIRRIGRVHAARLLVDLGEAERALHLVGERAGDAGAADAATRREADGRGEVAAAALAVQRVADRAEARGIERRRSVQRRPLEVLEHLGGVWHLLGRRLEVLRRWLVGLRRLLLGDAAVEQLDLLRVRRVLAGAREQQPAEQQETCVQQDRQ